MAALKKRAQEILEQVEKLREEINQLKEDTKGLPGNNNVSKDLESTVQFLTRTEIDLKNGYEKIEVSEKLIEQYQKEDHKFVRAVQIELSWDEQGKITSTSPAGCSFMVAEGIDPVGKQLEEIQCSESARVIGWYGSKPVVNYRALGEESSVITVSELKQIIPSLELEQAA